MTRTGRLATPDGAPARAAARHPSGRCGAARSRRGRSRPDRERARRDGVAGPALRRAAPGRSLRGDALDRRVLVGGADRTAGSGRDRPGFRPARAEADRGAGDAGRTAVARSGAAPRRGSAGRRVLLGARAAAAGSRLRSGRLGAAAERPGHRKLGARSARCAPRRARAGDLRRSGARRIPLRQFCRGASGRLPVPVARRGRAAAAGRGGYAARQRNRAGHAHELCWPEHCRGAAPAETGPTICACFGVGLRTLHDTIAQPELDQRRRNRRGAAGRDELRLVPAGTARDLAPGGVGRELSA